MGDESDRRGSMRSCRANTAAGPGRMGACARCRRSHSVPTTASDLMAKRAYKIRKQ